MTSFICNIVRIFIFFLILGCGTDPILERAKELEDEKNPVELPKEVSPDDASSEPKSSKVAPPKIAPPKIAPPKVAPPKVAPPKELSTEEVAPPPRNPKDGPFIKIAGTVVVDGWSGKKIRIDIFDGDQQNIGGQRPSVIISKTLSAIGNFEIDLPKSDSQLWIGAYIDEDEDGRPGPQDPSGWYGSNPISASKDHSGITVRLNVPDAPNPK